MMRLVTVPSAPTDPNFINLCVMFSLLIASKETPRQLSDKPCFLINRMYNHIESALKTVLKIQLLSLFANITAAL